MSESLAAQTAALQQAYRRYRRCVFLFLPLLVLAGVCLFWNRYVALAVLGAAVLYQVFYLRRQQKAYAARFNRENLLCTVCPALGAAAPEEKGGAGITPQTVRAAALMPLDDTKNSALFCQGIRGERDGLSIALCDATLGESFELVAKGRHRVHFNCGCWFHIVLPRDTGCDWRVLHKDSVPTPIRMAYFARRTELESAPLPEAFRDNFALYRPLSAPEQAPSAAVLKQLRLLAEYTPGYPAISLRGNTLDVFLRGRFLARPVSMAAAPTEKDLAFDPMPELAYLIRLAKVAADGGSAAE